MLFTDNSLRDVKARDSRDCDSAAKAKRIPSIFSQGSSGRIGFSRPHRERESVGKRITLLEGNRKQLNFKTSALRKKNSVSSLGIHKGYLHKEPPRERDEKLRPVQESQLSRQVQFHLPQLRLQPKLDRPQPVPRLPRPEKQPEGPEPMAPMSGRQALTRFQKLLSEWQQSQIVQYETVYYVGGQGRPQGALQDAAGYYQCRPGDHLDYRYQVQRCVGKGSFGQVFKVLDHKEHETVAVKIIRSRPKYASQAQNEVRMLQTMNQDEQSQVVRLRGHFSFRGHVCMVFDLLYCNLYRLSKSTPNQQLPLDLLRKLATQLLTGLQAFSKRGVLHCDLKPENIMVKSKGSSLLRIIDLGSSCYQHEATRDYIQSRFYRAPQVLLGYPPLTPKIDMWSLVTILAELYLGHPLFPGQSETEQILNLGQVLGPPPPHLVLDSVRGSWYFEDGDFCVIDKRGQQRKLGSRPLEDIFGRGHFTDFLRRGLTWLGSQRMSPDEGLEHPWIRGREEPEEERP